MNTKKWLVLSLIASTGIALLGFAGCSKGGGSIDTSKVQSAFENAPPVDKAEAQNAITAVKSQDYAGALASCKKVVTSANLTPEQKSAVQDLMGQIKSKGLGLGQSAVGGAGEMTNQVQGAGKAADDSRTPAKP
jgi:hypothetical protein